MLPLFVAGFGVWLAYDTSRRICRHGGSGMTAGMAAMMAAMGSGLSLGYAAGMVWDLGWANLIGVVAGLAHGLWMGRRFGAMAALDGAGGGVMGGLMGPMLAVMLVAMPLSLAWTAGLMLLLQWFFSLGAIYLVAAAVGQARTRWMKAAGRLLGVPSGQAGAVPDHYAALGVSPEANTAEIAAAYVAAARVVAAQPEQLASVREALAVLSDPLRRARYDVARLEDLEHSGGCPPQTENAIPSRTRRPRVRAMPETPGGAGGQRPTPSGARATPATGAARRPALARIAMAAGAAGVVGAAYVAATAARGADSQVQRAPGSPDGAGASGSVSAPVGEDGVQQVNLTLNAPYYGPALTEVKRGVPVRVTLTAVGDPG